MNPEVRRVNAFITVDENLALSVGRHVVAHLEADQALDSAARLARREFRRIAVEEGAVAVLDDNVIEPVTD